MKNFAIIVFLGLLLQTFLSEVSRCAQLELYISPLGTDINPGTFDRPFASLDGARNHIRKLKDEGLQSDVIVYLREGTYFLSETLVFGLEDSAPDGYKITYSNFASERPVLSSGVKLTGWTRVTTDIPGLPDHARGKIWSTSLPDELHSFYTLYDGGSRLPRAVTKGFYPIFSKEDEKPVDNLDELYHMYFPAGRMRHWDNIEDVEIVIIPNSPWTMNILPLESVDEKRNIAKTKIPGTYPLRGLSRSDVFPDGTVWVENVFEGLDSAGKWVLNTRTRKIYLWPGGEQPGDGIVAPKLSVLIKVEGETNKEAPVDIPVTGLHFKGLTFTQADRSSWTLTDSGIQHDWDMEDKDNALLRFRGAEHCSIEACRFFNSGGNGIRLDLHAQHIEVKNNVFHDLGAAAVLLLGYGPGTKDVNKHNKVVNNHIYDCGKIWWHSQMITVWQSGHNLIAHNYIHHVPRKAICIAGVRPPFFAPGRPDQRECRRSIRFNETGGAARQHEIYPFLHARRNVVEYNYIHNALEMLGDGAAINLSGTDLGNVVRYNFIHDIHNVLVDACIRTDNAQHGTLISHNILYNSYAPGICPKGYNTVHNNLMVNVSMGNNKGMIRALGNFGNSDVTANIFFSTEIRDHFYTYIKDSKPPEVYTMMNDNTIDRNIYYSTTNPGIKNLPSLADLLKNGFDKYSVYADPLFINWENGDFRLSASSPAFKLGIDQVDIVGKVGLTDDFPAHFRKH
jgi:hypothetical protein